MNSKKTGFASIDKPWLSQYSSNYDVGLNKWNNRTVWDVTEEMLEKYSDVPIIEYFGNSISREEFARYVETWARTFRALGVEKGDIIPLYVPATPEAYAMFFAANAIGAIPYYQKLDITRDALERETIGAKIAVVFDALWGNVQKVFSDSRFKNIVVLSASDSMLFPLKQISKMKSYFANRRSDAGIPNDAKYIWTNDAIKMAKYYSGEYRIPFESNIIAAITTSSGTTSNNVKGIMDTNEGILSSLGCILHSDSGYGVGKRTLTCFPPTASTSLNCLQLSPTFTGGTIIFDPRADTSIWYEQLMKYKPDVTITTGSVWERFATDILKKEKQGRKHDLSWVDYFIMGGSGTTPRILNRINDILLERGAQREIRVGYGLSEVFGVLSVSVYDGSYQEKNNKKDVISVGIPLNGYTVGIFDENNNELPFGKGLRGELRVKSPSNMEGYYNQPEATSRVLVDGWVRTGDLCEMDELGNIYIYGRTNNAITVEDKKMYLFDIEIDLRRTFNLHDVIVEKRQLADNELALLVYFVQDSESTISSEELIKQMEEHLALKNIYVNGFKEHMDSLPIDPTTLKPRRRDNDGFIKTIDGEKYDVSFELLEGDVYLEKRVRRG